MDFGSRVSLMVSLSLFSLSLSLSLSNALSLFKNKFRYVNTSEHTSHHINFAQQQQKTLISNSVSNNHTAQRRRQEAKRRTRTELEVEKGDESSYSSGLEWPYGSMRARRWAQAAFAKPFYGGRKDAKETTERGSTSQRKGSQTENSKKKNIIASRIKQGRENKKAKKTYPVERVARVGRYGHVQRPTLVLRARREGAGLGEVHGPPRHAPVAALQHAHHAPAAAHVGDLYSEQ